MKQGTCIIVMGVSGSGKTVIGEKIATQLGAEFMDADDFHPEANIQKMSSGIPLTDEDRFPWLENVGQLVSEHLKAEKTVVVACSALKKIYRDMLRNEISGETKFLYLKSSFADIIDRLEKRKGHFMPPTLLRSQFDTLEEPTTQETDSFNIDGSQSIEDVVQSSITTLNKLI